MTDVKISALSAKTTPAGTEEVPLNDGGTNKKMTLTNLVSLVTRAALGLATSDTPQFTGIEVGAASDTTLTRASAGNLAVEGNALYRAGGTDVPVADGGTGSSTAAGAATNLGLGTGDSPQFAGIEVGHASDTTVTRTGAGDIAVEGNGVYRAGGTDVPVTDGGTGASTAATARTNLGIASVVGGVEWTTVTKASDESVTSSTVLQDDNELLFATVSGGVYEFEAFIIYASPAGAGTPDIKLTFLEDATLRGSGAVFGISTADAPSSGSLSTNAVTVATLGTAAANRAAKVIYGCHVANGSNLKLQWAQNTSDANATIVRAGSVLRYRRIL